MLDQSLESYTPLLTFSDFWENKNKKTNFMLRVRSAKQHKGQLTRSVFDIDKDIIHLVRTYKWESIQ